MRIPSRIVAATALAVTAIGAAPLGSVHAATSRSDTVPPSVTVTPSHQLRGGDTVHVVATGITPSASVVLIQCDAYFDDPEADCFPRVSATADGSGVVSTTDTLADPVPKSEEFGDPNWIYCRADQCRIFVAWTDPDGIDQVAASPRLHFNGSPATISLSQSTNLYANQSVHVTGTAYGAGPRLVQVSEEACFSIIQGSGCYGQRKVRTLRAQHDGSFSLDYVVHRYLSDGTDCADPGILGGCEVTATILKADGTPDDSFGVSSRGQPAAWLSFRGS